jgi:hypothetical protein
MRKKPSLDSVAKRPHRRSPFIRRGAQALAVTSFGEPPQARAPAPPRLLAHEVLAARPVVW